MGYQKPPEGHFSDADQLLIQQIDPVAQCTDQPGTPGRIRTYHRRYMGGFPIFGFGDVARDDAEDLSFRTTPAETVHPIVDELYCEMNELEDGE